MLGTRTNPYAAALRLRVPSGSPRLARAAVAFSAPGPAGAAPGRA